MFLNDFDYQLPESLIARKPLAARTASRMMCLDRQKNCITHQSFSDIINHLNSGDMLVINDTKVIPARFYAEKPTGGRVTLLIDTLIDTYNASVRVQSNKALHLPLTLRVMDSTINITLVEKNGALYHMQAQDAIEAIIAKYGEMPLPPYMQRPATAEDDARYQTVFAQHPGAIAAPTAGLHFDEKLLCAIKQKGVYIAPITLHVGSGTFSSVREQDLTKHVMHSESIDIHASVAQRWAETKKSGGRVIAVGTTAVRSLESAFNGTTVTAKQGKTNLFITPGYRFNTIDALITNFHLPKSTLLMLISAFAGHTFTMRAYQEAVDSQYRFFSYGDAMFIS